MVHSDSYPPLLDHYGTLLSRGSSQIDEPRTRVTMEECQLPLIDLCGLTSADETVRRACADAICRASSEWGFFQVVNHGISHRLVEKMRSEQVKLFQAPFKTKAKSGLLNNSYRWGNPRATCPDQFSWSEAFHVPLTKVSDEACYGEFTSLRNVMTCLAAAMSELSRLLARILTENLGHGKQAMIDNICDETTCFLRLNHYPACPISPEMTGLVPHTDSDFLTILCQDQVGGLQLMKDSKWVTVKPNKDALIVNIGDLFQAWSNDVYKSVEHKVVTNATTDRYSIAYFLCPYYDSLIESFVKPSIYRRFTFREYRDQVQEDVRKTGYKVGLPRFLLEGSEENTRLYTPSITATS
ncbi:Gibberellin 2-beta-dioxygenase 8 [Hibiscus syriacus]|uniref:gibberellin 2beta-dioxygenase n=1 Tax=Hibiscus syriacus TaxID=106335 RepID=A0A6A2WZB5_HIBSY|nr:gibberellin 2-beta-dioxygenase 6-like [Hibiscus syriacus]KAE8667248.1 Gibberellin 2-beta-dioxygenase 8 [Hibiscus syriacus]